MSMYSSSSPELFHGSQSSSPSTPFMVPEGPILHRPKVRCNTTNMESEYLKSDVAKGNQSSPRNSPASNNSSVNNSKDYNYIPLNDGRNSKWSPMYCKKARTPESLRRDNPFYSYSPRRERNNFGRRRGNSHYNKRSLYSSSEDFNPGHSPNISLYVSPRFLEDPWQHLYKSHEGNLSSEANSS